MRLPTSLALIASLAISGAVLAQGEEADTPSGGIEFRHALTNKPLDMDMLPAQEFTEAVRTFHQTGENPYAGDPEAIEAGKAIYDKQCAACHLEDGSGRIGPDLTDDNWRRERANSRVGRFEVIYGGSAGAMQAFGKRIEQDEILKVMAYINTFRE